MRVRDTATPDPRGPLPRGNSSALCSCEQPLERELKCCATDCGQLSLCWKLCKAVLVAAHSLEENRNINMSLGRNAPEADAVLKPGRSPLAWTREGGIWPGQLSGQGGPSTGWREGECPGMPMASPQGPCCQQWQPGPYVPTYSTFINMYFYVGNKILYQSL